MGDPAALLALLTALSDENGNVRSSAARALDQPNDPSALPALLTALSDEDSDVRSSAARALGQLGDPAALPALLIALNDENGNVRSSAASTLGQLDDPAALPALLTALSDEDSDVRSSAASALTQPATTEVISLIPMISLEDGRRYEIAKVLVRRDPTNALLLLDHYERQSCRESWIECLRGQAQWQLGHIEAAFASLHQAINREKKDNSDNFLALAHFHLEQGNLEAAREYVEQALGEMPKWSLCLLSHAVVLWYLGSTEEALAKLAQAQRGWRQISQVKYLQHEHFWREKAIAALEAMLAAQQEQA